MSIFGSALAGLGSLVGAGADIYNVRQQKKQFEWQKMAQEKTWAREDNATQRRVADLKAAGLSPTLAAGSAAQASSPITPKAPQADMSNMMNGLAISNMVENIAKTKAEKKRIQQETDIVQHDFDKLKNTPMFYFNHHQDWAAVAASAITRFYKEFLPGLAGKEAPSVSPNINLGAITDEGEKRKVIPETLKLDRPPTKDDINTAIVEHYKEENSGKPMSVGKPPHIIEMKKAYDDWIQRNPEGSIQEFYKYVEQVYGKIL